MRAPRGQAGEQSGQRGGGVRKTGRGGAGPAGPGGPGPGGAEGGAAGPDRAEEGAASRDRAWMGGGISATPYRRWRPRPRRRRRRRPRARGRGASASAPTMPPPGWRWVHRLHRLRRPCVCPDAPRPPPRPVAFSCLRLIARRGVGGLTKLRHESLRIKLQRGDADGSALRGRTRQQRGGWKDYAVARAMGWMGYAYGNNYNKISLH